jgi:dipeptidyl aminopeptidase/acylaminoacyl peptidase
MDRFMRLALLTVALIQVSLADAQTKAPSLSSALSAETMWSLKRLGDPAISADGRLAVVPVTRFDVAQNKGFTELWLISTDGAAVRQLTSGPGSASQPVFSPDGKYVAFVSKRGEDEQAQIYVIAIDGGEAMRVTSIPTGASIPKWTPDSRRLAFVSPIWMDLPRWEDQGKRMKERAESKMSGRVWDRAPIAYWDHLLDDRELHIFTVAVEGGEPVPVTRASGYSLPKAEDLDDFIYDISPDAQEIVFTADIDKSGIDQNYDLVAVATCGCKPARDLTVDSPADDGNPRYSPDGRSLAFTQQRLKGFYADRARLMIQDRASGKTRGLTEDWDRTVDDPIWQPDGKSIFASIDDAGTIRVYRFDIRGGVPKAVTKSPSFTALATARGIGVATRQSFSEPPTLVRLDLNSGSVKKLSTFNDAALAAIDFGNVESVVYKGARGDDVQMWVVYPPGFDPGKKYPVYMLLHGGPHNGITDATQWRWNAQVFAAWGYIVTWHNFHGSSGFGQSFADSINPDRISLPYEDTIKAADWLMQRDYVDKERMATGGGSYGGFLAATILGREHPFKTVIAHAAVYNSFTQIAADYGASKPRFFYFWDKPEEFARYSPHTFAGQFKTPTLVIHGQQDLRVPVNQGIELFNTLQSRGVPSKLLYFPDENHWVLKPQNSLYWYKTVREWLEQYAPAGAR